MHILIPSIKLLISKCKYQIPVDINISWAYFDKAFYHFLIGNIYESVQNNILGIRLSNEFWMVSTALNTFSLLDVDFEAI